MPKNGMVARWVSIVLTLLLAVAGGVYLYTRAEAKASANEVRINKIEEQNGETLTLIRQIDRRQVRIMVELGIPERNKR